MEIVEIVGVMSLIWYIIGAIGIARLMLGIYETEDVSPFQRSVELVFGVIFWPVITMVTIWLVNEIE